MSGHDETFRQAMEGVGPGAASWLDVNELTYPGPTMQLATRSVPAARFDHVAVADFNKKEQPSGMFCYDPKKDAWHEIKPANTIPPHNGWFGWLKLCYDSHNDCFIGMVGDRLYAFRYVPAK